MLAKWFYSAKIWAIKTIKEKTNCCEPHVKINIWPTKALQRTGCLCDCLSSFSAQLSKAHGSDMAVDPDAGIIHVDAHGREQVLGSTSSICGQ